VLNQYGKTTVTVIGHTDSVGSDAYNQTVGKARAVGAGLLRQPERQPAALESYGKGETEPRADNSTEAGRALNRRVELCDRAGGGGNLK
jgi:outer membrane protein OmpA-like peptidoglycan-associated protein